ncbi:MAG TPA: hypothetical protein VKR32_13485 [Puia sp.]|nr:hypothetical protein [Puia sp.]
MSSLPFCQYPDAFDKRNRGVLALPDELPSVDFARARPYRSFLCRSVSTSEFSADQWLELARMIGLSFTTREPMVRHLHLPLNRPGVLRQAIRKDQFSCEPFGEWTKENILHWMLRVWVFTRRSNDTVWREADNEFKNLSMAILDREHRIIGGSVSFRYSIHLEDDRVDDSFKEGILAFTKPIVDVLQEQERCAIHELGVKYADFLEACKTGKVVDFFMVARSDYLGGEYAFELVAASIENFKARGYRFVVTSAANPWTGAAFELLNAVRVHYTPYRERKRVAKSETGLPEEVSSSDGYISAKESGCMFYVLSI